MEERATMNLTGAFTLLRRLWLVPTIFAIGGIILGASSVVRSDVVVAESTLVLSDDRSINFLTSKELGEIRLGPTVTELKSLLTSDATRESVADAIAGTHLSVTDTPAANTIILRISGDDEAQVRKAADAFIKLATGLRTADAKRVSEGASRTIAASKTALQAFLDGEASSIEPPNGSNVVIVDRGEAAAELVQLSLMQGQADQLADFDGGVAATTRVAGSTGRALPGILLGVVFFGLGVAAVLVLGPLDSRIRTRRDIERVSGASLLAVCASADATMWSLASAIAALRAPTVFLVPAAAGSVEVVAVAVRQALSESGNQTNVRSTSLGGPAFDELLISTDPVVVVVRSGLDRRADLSEAQQGLSNAGRKPVGVALVGVSSRDRRATLE